MKKIVLGVSAIALAFAFSVSFASAANYNFQTNLTVGATGSEVTALQSMLVAKNYLSMPAGVAYGYFGTLTKTAVAKLQADNQISPAAGYFGPVTRAKVNMWSADGGATGGSNLPAGCTSTAGYSSTTGVKCSTGASTGGSLGGGEASLEDLNAKDGDDDDVEEGGTADVAEFEFDVEDADVEVERVDLSFEVTASAGQEDEPWKTFDTISLWADGKELASEDVSDEDDWLEEDEPYVFRFNQLDYVVKEGEKGKIVVRVEAQDGIDGLSTSDIPWTVYIDTDGLRAIDGEGIDQYIGEDDESVSFDITEEGGDDDLSVRRNSDDPDSTTFQVEDNGSSDWYTVFAFDFDSDEESDDIEINDLPITFTTSDRVADVINDIKLVIDGEEYDDYGSFSSTTASTASTTFDIDGDVVIEGGDRVKVEVMVEFKTASTSSTYPDGTTVSASVVGSQIDAEGADDVDVDGSATGDTHTLRVMGVDVEAGDKSDDTQAPSVQSGADIATFYVEVDVTAFEQDVFIPRTGPLSFTYQVEDSAGTAVSTASTTATSSTISATSGAETDGNYYVVNEGDTETFRLQVTFDPANYKAEQYRLQILSLSYNDAAATPDTTYTASPASDFETPYKLIAE